RHWPAARRALGVRRDRLGRLLLVGSGGERRADALARRDGLPALGDDPGEARDAEGLERPARRSRVLPAAVRHVSDPRSDECRRFGLPRLWLMQDSLVAAQVSYSASVSGAARSSWTKVLMKSGSCAICSRTLNSSARISARFSGRVGRRTMNETVGCMMVFL